MANAKRVYVAGTCDTKGAELAFVADLIRAAGLPALIADLSTGRPDTTADIGAREIAGFHPEGASAVFTGDRGRSVAAMALAFERYLAGARRRRRHHRHRRRRRHLDRRRRPCAPCRSACPSSWSRPSPPAMSRAYVGPSDIVMMPSVTDIAGLNRISRVVLANAAHAHRRHGGAPRRSAAAADKPAIGLTMFGVTTPCVHARRRARCADRL